MRQDPDVILVGEIRDLETAKIATEAALTGAVGEGWPWVRLLAVFAVVFSAVGVLTFGTLLEDS